MASMRSKIPSKLMIATTSPKVNEMRERLDFLVEPMPNRPARPLDSVGDFGRTCPFTEPAARPQGCRLEDDGGCPELLAWLSPSLSRAMLQILEDFCWVLTRSILRLYPQFLREVR